VELYTFSAMGVPVRAASGEEVLGAHEVPPAFSVAQLKVLLQQTDLCHNRNVKLLLSSRILNDAETVYSDDHAVDAYITAVLQLQGVRGRTTAQLAALLEELEASQHNYLDLLALPEGSLPTETLRALAAAEVSSADAMMVGGGTTYMSRCRLMMFAVLSGSEDFVRALVHDGADVNRAVVSIQGTIPERSVLKGMHSALYFAITEKNASMVKLLLDLGADVNTTAVDTSDAIPWSSREFSPQQVWTPLDVARDIENSDEDVIALLSEAFVAAGGKRQSKLLDF